MRKIPESVIVILSLILVVGCKKSKPDEALSIINHCQTQLDSALTHLEQEGRLDEALEIYGTVEAQLNRLNLDVNHPHYRDKQQVLAYCLLRKGNIVRQYGKIKEAITIGEKELIAAQAARDTITLARTLMSVGSTLLSAGEIETGLAKIEEARLLFEQGKNYDYKQGLGWYWILQGDIANAGLRNVKPEQIIEFANSALDILAPIENWPGVARAYAIRAKAYEDLGMLLETEADRAKQAEYEALVQGKVKTEKR